MIRYATSVQDPERVQEPVLLKSLHIELNKIELQQHEVFMQRI